MDAVLREHLIDPECLRDADFDAYFDARWASMLELVERAMGKPVQRDWDDVHGYRALRI